MMAAVFMFVVKAALIGLLFIGCYFGLDKHSARLRYQWLSAVSILFLLFPLLDQLLNSFDITVAVRPNHLLLSEGIELLQAPWVQLGLLFYSFVGIWLLLYLLLGLFQLSKYRQSADAAPRQLQQLINDLSRRIGLARAPDLKLHGNNAMSPCTFGSFRPVVLLPANAVDWPTEQLEMVLLHELAHIKHHDFLRLNGARLLLAFYWFLPPAWWLLAELKKLSEQLADDTVLNVGANDADYAEVLLRAGRLHKETGSMAVAVNGNGEYYQRVMTVLDRYVDRTAQANKSARPLFWFLILSAFSAAAVDLSVENKGYLKLPVDMINIQKIQDMPAQQAESGNWNESLKVVAMAADTAPAMNRVSRFEMSGYLAGDIEMPSAELFKGLSKDIDIRANFNIDENGRAYAVKVKPEVLKPSLRKEISRAILNSQFSVHKLNGEPVIVTGAEQRYQVMDSKVETKGGGNTMNIKKTAVLLASCAYASCSSALPEVVVEVAEDELAAPVKSWKLESFGKARYPQRAWINGMQGWVDVKFDINSIGEASNLEVIETSNARNFVRDARIFVKSYRFTKLTDNASPVEDLVFRLCFIYSKTGKEETLEKFQSWGCGFIDQKGIALRPEHDNIAMLYTSRALKKKQKRNEPLKEKLNSSEIKSEKGALNSKSVKKDIEKV